MSNTQPSWSISLAHSEEKTIGDILKTFNKDQMNVLNYLLNKSLSLSEQDKKELLKSK